MARHNEEFTMIFNEVYPNLCRFLESMMGERGAAQDIAQETFLRLHRAGANGPPAREARFWLYRVARNLALNELNKRRNRSRLFGKVIDAFRPETPDPEKEFERAESKSIVARLLETLPEHQRAAILLREQEEMSYAEIARVLNISKSKVKVDIFRARSALRAGWSEIENAQAKSSKSATPLD